MKRFALLLLTMMILLMLFGREALVPGRFTGIWYEEQTGLAYRFEEGIIRETEKEDFRGAYSFTRDSVTLFVSGAEELDTVQTLRWRSGKEGGALYTETGELRFRRMP